MRALVIDDEPGVAEVLYYILTLKGVVTEKVATTKEGLELLAQIDYALVITDLKQVPSGIDVYKMATSKGALSRIITGGADDLTEAKMVAGNDLLMKPFNINEIYIVVEQAKQSKL